MSKRLRLAAVWRLAQNQPDHRALDAVALALLAAGAAALVFRRQYPGWVLIFVNGITLLYLLLDYPKGPIFLTTIIAFFTAVMQGRRLIAWAVLAAEFVDRRTSSWGLALRLVIMVAPKPYK